MSRMTDKRKSLPALAAEQLMECRRLLEGVVVPPAQDLLLRGSLVELLVCIWKSEEGADAPPERERPAGQGVAAGRQALAHPIPILSDTTGTPEALADLLRLLGNGEAAVRD